MNMKLGISALALAFAGALATTSHAQASTVHRASAAHDRYTAYAGVGTGNGADDEAEPIVFVVKGIERLVFAPQRACFTGTLGTLATGSGLGSERLFDAAVPH